jgi:hypothetical protein
MFMPGMVLGFKKIYFILSLIQMVLIVSGVKKEEEKKREERKKEREREGKGEKEEGG